MAFGALSREFLTFEKDLRENTTAVDFNSDTFNAMLYGNTGTPDATATATSANTAWNTGQWVTTNEVTATGWPSGGLALSSITSAMTGSVYTWDAADRAGGATDTVTAAFGVLIYDFTIATPVAKPGVCFLSFGGTQSVTGGQFTVSFNVLGILTSTV